MQQQTSSKKRLRRAWWFWVIITLAVVLVVAGGAVLADWMVYYGEIHAGVTVSGVYLRGMTEEQAAVALQRLVASTGGPVVLTGAGRTWTVSPQDVGRVVDIEGAVRQAAALTHTGDFFKDVYARFSLYRHAREIPLRSSVDKVKLDDIVRTLAEELHVTPQNAWLTMENRMVTVEPGVVGRDVDTAALAAEIETRFVTLHTEPVAIPLVDKQPDVRVADNVPAQAEAQRMLSASITVADGGKTWTISRQQLAGWLNFRAEYEGDLPTMVPYLSEGAMWWFLSGLAPQVYKAPVNAALTSPDGVTVAVVSGVDGARLDFDSTWKAIDGIAHRATGRTVQVAKTPVEPDITTAEAKAETFATQLSAFTTKYVCPPNRQQNVRITTQYATNVILAPGQEFDFDKQIGPRTEERGYKLAPGITGPNTLEDVLGGGICQVSTTMFNAVFFAGLKVTERWNHSIYINHYPTGRDATVSAGGKNLRFVNDTAHFIWIKGTSDGITTTISIFGTSDGRKVAYSIGKFYDVKSPTTVRVDDPTLPVGTEKVTDKGQTGRKLKTFRTVTMPDGTVLHNDEWTSVWPMYPVTISVGTKPKTP